MARYEVIIHRYGTRSTVKSDVFLNYSVYGDPDEPIGMDYFFWVVRGEGRTILVDTGFSPAGGAARKRTTVADPAAVLATLDAPTVVVTHAHYDHIGNLGLLPSAPIVLARREFEFWTGPFARRAQFHHSVEDAELDTLRQAADDGRVTLFDGAFEVAPGVHVLEVGGHTPGQSVVTVPTAEGLVVLASDAVHYYEEYELDRPFAHVANLVDMYAAFDRIRGLAAAHLVAGHDPATLSRFGGAGHTAVIGAR